MTLNIGPSPFRKEKDPDFNIDEWEPEDPLWMTKLPEDVDSNPALAAIHNLIYEGTTPEEVASNFKRQGNDYFNSGITGYAHAGYWYSRAIDHPGIKDVELLSQLFANRAAVLLGLGNFGRCLLDVNKSLEYSKNNCKAYFRGAKAAAKLRKFDVALRYCDDALTIDSNNKAMLAEKQVILQERAAESRRQAERDNKTTVRENKTQSLTALYKVRNIKVGAPFYKGIKDLLNNVDVYIDIAGKLHFPVMFIYEEFHKTDIVKDFEETQSFDEHFDLMFPEGEEFPGDEKGHYKRATIEIYVIMNHVYPLNSEKTGKRPRKVKVNSSTELGEVLSHPEYVMPGTPAFWIVSERFRESFLKMNIETLGHV